VTGTSYAVGVMLHEVRKVSVPSFFVVVVCMVLGFGRLCIFRLFYVVSSRPFKMWLITFLKSANANEINVTYLAGVLA
jgi:phosphoglycerol transferase MdoB-like AlkP superfamily enzyme